MKKIYTKGNDKTKSKLIAKVYGKNVIEFRRKGRTWKVVGDNLQVIAMNDDEPEVVRSFELVDGEVKSDDAEAFEIKEAELKDTEDKKKEGEQ